MTRIQRSKPAPTSARDGEPHAQRGGVGNGAVSAVAAFAVMAARLASAPLGAPFAPHWILRRHIPHEPARRARAEGGR